MKKSILSFFLGSLALVQATVFVSAQSTTMSGRVTAIEYPTDTADVEAVRRAGTEAVDALVGDFIHQQPGSGRFAVMPLLRDIDSGYFTLQLRSELTNQGRASGIQVITRDEGIEKQFIAEIRRGDQIGDTMDPATIQKFGRMQGVSGIIVGRITGIFEKKDATDDAAVRLSDYRRSIQVRISIQAFEVETGRQLWGGERIGTVTLADEGIVLPGSRREWLIYGGGGLIALLLVLFFLRTVFKQLKSANRPR